ncbi:tetratricopeptide repeat protein [Oesophagostomum dentatum]|uniref:Tetratricopeptide repeat protein n=1 Tax=Oesophagostomum dentatum TaxID=61180 RepID=A0A0B1SXW2_OESDE|nr:tetratricopeptide repeat protein [Oesophagostomum dentatum]
MRSSGGLTGSTFELMIQFGRLFTLSSAFLLLTLYATRTYSRNLDWRDEESLYRSALHLNPPKGRGLLYQDRRNFTPAVKCYENAVKYRKTFATAYLNLGDVHQQRGKDDLAATTWDACSRIDGSMVKAQRDHRQAQTSCRLRLGRLLYRKKNYSEARKILEEAVHAAPSSYQFLASLWFSLGEVYDAQGQDHKAEEAFRTALQTAPEHVPSMLTLGYLKNKQNQTLESNRWFSQALAVSSDSVEVYHHIGTAAALRHNITLKGDVIEAEAAYTAALNLSATHMETLRALGTLLREQGKYDKCEEVLETLQSHHPSAESFGDYGAILHLNGKLKKAKEFYEKSLTLNPNSSIVRENLGKLLRKMSSTGIESKQGVTRR